MGADLHGDPPLFLYLWCFIPLRSRGDLDQALLPIHTPDCGLYRGDIGEVLSDGEG